MNPTEQATATEPTIGLARVAGRFGVNPGTVGRWITRGVMIGDTRVKLAGRRIGKHWRTTEASLAAFIVAINPEAGSVTPDRTPTERRRASEAASKSLAAAGW